MDKAAILKQAVTTEENMVKPASPAEKTREKILNLRREDYEIANEKTIENRKWVAQEKSLKYAIRYLRWHYRLSNPQIINLPPEDYNNLPEIISAEKKLKVMLLGWIPIFGWGYAVKYILFRKRIKFLKSRNENLYYESARSVIENYLNQPRPISLLPM